MMSSRLLRPATAPPRWPRAVDARSARSGAATGRALDGTLTRAPGGLNAVWIAHRALDRADVHASPAEDWRPTERGRRVFGAHRRAAQRDARAASDLNADEMNRGLPRDRPEFDTASQTGCPRRWLAGHAGQAWATPRRFSNARFGRLRVARRPSSKICRADRAEAARASALGRHVRAFDRHDALVPRWAPAPRREQCSRHGQERAQRDPDRVDRGRNAERSVPPARARPRSRTGPRERGVDARAA